MDPVMLHVAAGRQPVPVRFRTNRRARRYILRLRPEGMAVVTIPRFGSRKAALEFAQKNAGWIQRRLDQQRSGHAVDRLLKPGSQVLLDGTPRSIWVDMSALPHRIFLGNLEIGVYPGDGHDLRPCIEAYLRRQAETQLRALAMQMAGEHMVPIKRVSVRNQKTRWGSCSRRGTISLNWRLVQTPDFVRDYVIMHEMAHVRHMNHSPAFWSEVFRLCPDYKQAEAWLKQNARLLR